MKLLIFLFILFSISHISAQEIQVLSKQTQEPIAFATFAYIENDSIIGLVRTNEQGKVKLNIPKKIKLIRVYATNYHTEDIEIDKIPSKIFLDDDFVHLDEVMITSEKKTTKTLGYASKRTHSGYIFASGQENVTLIQNPYNEDKNIKSLLFVFYRRNQNLDVIFKIHLYKNKDNKPTESYQSKNKDNLYTLKKGRGTKQKITIDIQDWNISLPKEGLFVGIEYIGKIDEKTKNIVPEFMPYEYDINSDLELAVGINYIKTKKIIYTYNRFNISNIHEKAKEWHNTIDDWRYLDKTNKDTYYSPAIGIEVYE